MADDDDDNLTEGERKIQKVTDMLREAYGAYEEGETTPLYRLFQSYQMLVYRDKGFNLETEQAKELVNKIAEEITPTKEEKNIKTLLAANTADRDELNEQLADDPEGDEAAVLTDLINSKTETIEALKLAAKAYNNRKPSIFFIILKLCKKIQDERAKVSRARRLESLMDRLYVETAEALKQDVEAGNAVRSKTKASKEKATAAADTAEASKQRALLTKNKLELLNAKMTKNKEITEKETLLYKQAAELKLAGLISEAGQVELRQQVQKGKNDLKQYKLERAKAQQDKERQRIEDQKTLDQLNEENKTDKLKINIAKARQIKEAQQKKLQTNTTTPTPPVGNGTPYTPSYTTVNPSFSQVEYLVVTTGTTPSNSKLKLSELYAEFNALPEYKVLKETNHCLKVIDSLLREKSI